MGIGHCDRRIESGRYDDHARRWALSIYARLLGQYDPESAGQTDGGEDPGAEHWEG